MRYATLIFVALLAGCATPYQETGLLGGVSAVQIDATTLRISGRGNAYTSSATVQNYVLLKAAEETMARGYDMFLILDAKDASSTSIQTFNQAQVYGGYGSAQAFGTSFSVPISKPGEDAVIRMLKGQRPVDAPPNLFVAAEIITYIGPEVIRP